MGRNKVVSLLELHQSTTRRIFSYATWGVANCLIKTDSSAKAILFWSSLAFERTRHGCLSSETHPSWTIWVLHGPNSKYRFKSFATVIWEIQYLLKFLISIEVGSMVCKPSLWCRITCYTVPILSIKYLLYLYLCVLLIMWLVFDK